MSTIARVDIHGTPLKEGDIVAEGKIDDEIWQGQAVILQRPLGIVVTYRNPTVIGFISPEETDFYNVVQIKRGVVKLTDKAEGFLRKNSDSDGFMDIHISRHDGNFYAWDNIEIIGSVYDMI